MPFIFKASYDKANRTAGTSFRGPGLDEGLRILAGIKSKYDVPILTDIHEPSQARRAAEVADVLQIPAFLSRQTDLIAAAAATGRVVNIKKGQFLAPDDIRHAVAKAVAAGNPRVIVTERGTSFGYHNLVVDMRAFPMMRAQGVPVVFDVTHSLQLPGGGDGVTAGLGEYIEPLGSAGVAAGVDGVFLEVHDDPARARSDAQNALPPGSARAAAATADGHRRDREKWGRASVQYGGRVADRETRPHGTYRWVTSRSRGRCSKPKPRRSSRWSIGSTSASNARSSCCGTAAAASS